MAQARIEVEARTEQATRQLHQLTQSQQRLQGSILQTASAAQVATANTQQFTQALSQQISQAAALGQQLGTNLPGAAGTLTTKATTLGKALGAALKVTRAISFLSAVVDLGTAIGELILKARGLGSELEATVRQAEQMNDLLLGQRTAADIRKQIGALTRERNEFIRILGTKDPNSPRALFLASFSREAAHAREGLQRVNRRLGQLVPLAMRAAQQERQLAKETEKVAAATDKRARSLGKLNEEEERRNECPALPMPQEPVTPTEDEAREKESRDALQIMLDIQAQLIPQKQQLNELEEKREELLQRLPDEIEQGTIAQLSGTARIIAERDRELRKLDEQIQKYGQFKDVVELLEKKKELAIREANRRIEEENKKVLDKMSSRIEAFIQRAVRSIRSFRDVFKLILGGLLNLFIRTVARMVANWLFGLRQMQGAGGVRGFVGSLLGLLAGLGKPAGATVGAPGQPAAATAAAATQALAAGAATTAAATATQQVSAGAGVAGGGGGSATNLGGLAGLLDKLHGIGPIPGSVVAAGGGLLAMLGLQLGFSRGSPGLGAGLGAAGGALLGFAFGGPLGVAIGAVVGAIGGLFSGIFGRGRLKRKAALAETQMFEQLRQVVEQFKQFKVDFETALQQFDAIWEDFRVNAPRQFGFAGRRAVRNVAPFVAILRRQLLDLQETRKGRAELIAGLAIPEFQRGGLVDQFFGPLQAIQSGQGKILAFLHRGEAVLNAGAVRALGRSGVEQLNRAPGFQAGGLVGTAAAGTTVNIGPIVINQVPEGMTPQQFGELLMRQIERRLRDRGLRLGG